MKTKKDSALKPQTRGISRKHMDFLFLLAIRAFTRKAIDEQKEQLIKRWPVIPIRGKGLEKALIEHFTSMAQVEHTIGAFLSFMEDNGLMDMPVEYITDMTYRKSSGRGKGNKAVLIPKPVKHIQPGFGSGTSDAPTNANISVFNDTGNGTATRQPITKGL